MRRTTLFASAVASAALVALATVAAPGALAGPAPADAPCGGSAITSYPPPAQDAGPFGVTAGPGGVWYADGAYLTRIDGHGSHRYAVPDATALGWLTWDGQAPVVWFADRSTGRLGTIDRRGDVHEFQIPDGPNGMAGPQGIVLGPGPNVWFTDQSNDRIGELDLRSGEMTMHPVPSGDPLGLVRGADGALYFTERGFDAVGRLAADGTFTEWHLQPGSFPNRLVLGPDGDVWFTELRTNMIGRLAPDGTLTETAITGGPVGIAVGPGRHVYAALYDTRQLAQLDAAGNVARKWSVPGALQVAAGHGRLWLTDPFRDTVTSVRVSCAG